MKRNNVFIKFAALSLICLSVTSCSNTQNGYVDGYYTAETDAFDSHGWKEFVTICVSDGKIVTVEYNAKNPSGMIKAWDMNYMRTMNRVAGNYPNQYTRVLGGNLLKDQNADSIDAVTGATHSYATFQELAAAVLDLAESGKEEIVFVHVVEEE